jgi:2-oxoglutarate ferredoxin oxidoreductase subunit gamma
MIIGRAASIYGGQHATLIQSFGPEARGSACSAQVILSDREIGYPYVRGLDLLIVMSMDAYAKFVPELREGGLVLYESEMVTRPDGLPAGARALGIPATRFAEEIGRRMVMNIVMTGFFAGASGLLPFEAVDRAVADSVPPGTLDINRAALLRGFQHGSAARKAEALAP